MEEPDTIRLKKNWTILLDNVISEDITSHLIEDLVLDIDDVEEIEAKDTKKRRTRQLLFHLMRRGPAAYQSFRKALSQYDVYEHVVQRLDRTDVDLPTFRPAAVEDKKSTEQVDVGITQLEDDNGDEAVLSQASPLKSQDPPHSRRSNPPPQSNHQPQMLQKSPPATSSNGNVRIAGNNNFVIMGSSNTQVFYH